MKGTVLLSMVSILVVQVINGQYTIHPALQKRGQTFMTTMPVTTTGSPIPTTSFSLAPQTSISVHHTIVRNKPSYPFPYVESTSPTDTAEDTSYYYTYEDVSDEASRRLTSTTVPTTTDPAATITKPTIKSFWNSQKAMLDARRKESTQKYMSSFNKPSSSKKETKPTIEFKVREKPKFGQANKNKDVLIADTTKVDSKPKDESTTSAKMFKTTNEANSAGEKNSEKDNTVKKSASNLITNQIVGRIGEIPQSVQSPLRAQSTNINSYGASRSSKFDDSTSNVKFLDNARQQPLIQNTQSAQPSLRNSNDQPLVLPNNLNQQQLSLISQQLQNALNLNKQQQQLITQQTVLNNLNRPATAFIAANPPPATNTAARSADTNSNGQSTLLQRLGTLGLNLANGGLGGGLGAGNGLGGLALGRDGGGSGFTLNLGAVPDPLSFIIQLLSLIPRPLLDLNGRIFFGIELGKNAGLVSGAAKPVG